MSYFVNHQAITSNENLLAEIYCPSKHKELQVDLQESMEVSLKVDQPIHKISDFVSSWNNSFYDH